LVGREFESRELHFRILFAGGGLTPDRQTTASFGFSSTDATATFRCSLNGGAYSACTSPEVYSGLGAGTRQFNVESVDPAGNISLMTGSASWTVDLTPPVTTIATSVDKAHSTVAVTLSSTISGSTFQCSVDGQAYSSCRPSFTLRPPADGQNTLAVKATSPAGNVETTPATSTFAVYPAPPAPTVSLLKVPAPTVHTPPRSTPSTARDIRRPPMRGRCSIHRSGLCCRDAQ
jgi:hypothetical protein